MTCTFLSTLFLQLNQFVVPHTSVSPDQYIDNYTTYQNHLKMFDYINFILFATSTPILVNIAFRHPYSWLHTILLAQAFAVFFSFCSLIDAIFVQPFLFSSLRELPTAGQDLIWTRLFKEPTGDQLLRFMRQSPSSQIIRYFGVLNSERLLLTDPKDLKQVLDSEAYEFGRSYLIRRLLSPMLGKKSLVVMDGAEHIRCRKDIDPDFYSQHIADLCPMFWKNACSLVEAMTACSNGVDGQTPGPDNAVEILKWLEKTTFQVIVTAVFGTTTAVIQTHIEDLVAEFRDAFSISSGLHAQAEMAWETILPSHLFFGLIPLDDVRKTKSSVQGIKAYCQKQIAKRRLEVRARCCQLGG